MIKKEFAIVLCLMASIPFAKAADNNNAVAKYYKRSSSGIRVDYVTRFKGNGGEALNSVQESIAAGEVLGSLPLARVYRDLFGIPLSYQGTSHVIRMPDKNRWLVLSNTQQACVPEGDLIKNGVTVMVKLTQDSPNQTDSSNWSQSVCVGGSLNLARNFDVEVFDSKIKLTNHKGL